MMRSTRWLIVAGVSVFAIAVWLVANDGLAGDARVSAPSAQAAPVLPKAVALPAAPLPPLDAPLRAVVADLSRRARTGDRDAMCRLAAEHVYCGQLLARMQRLDAGMARLPAVSQDRSAAGPSVGERMAAVFDGLSQKYRHCEGVPPASSSVVLRYLREAAAAGHPQAAGYYVSGEMFRMRDTMRNLEELSLYRTNAESLALAAVRRGDLRATWELARAYAATPDDLQPTLLSQVVEPAPDKALTLLYRLRAGWRSPRPEDAAVLGRFEASIQSIEARVPAGDVARLRIDAAAQGPIMLGVEDVPVLGAAMSPAARGDFRRESCG